ncbi:DUF998 domain-containing protein [Nocardioides alcanivorans]|uniref:DUF998 domain-containing protein n=1 Tax=Nocardioides alcanivorans TaxID=2897352 RepID=UPI001F46CE68|nr:DUF998 domain-containing protein [Nocardioides alcanivorans]
MVYFVGAGGALLFVLIFLVDGLTRSGYSPLRHPVSALALSRRGWIQTLNFVLCGGAIAAGGAAVAVSGRSWLLGAILAIFGIALVASGLFRMDPMRGYPPGTADGDPVDLSTKHQLHDHAGAVVFLSLPAAAAVAAFVMPGLAWTALSAIVAAALVFAFDAFGKAWERDAPRTGLIQRAFIVPGWLWVAAVFLHFAGR